MYALAVCNPELLQSKATAMDIESWVSCSYRKPQPSI